MMPWHRIVTTTWASARAAGVSRLDFLTAQLSGQGDFETFCKNMQEGYSPTMRGDLPRREERRELADALDKEMKRRGSPVRCTRLYF